MDRTFSHLRTALCSSTQLEKSMYACLQSIPDSIVCDGIFFNYYRSDIRCIQFLALATHKTARLKRDVIPIPENIARQFNHSDNFSTQVIDNLSQCPLTEYVVSTCFRNIKSLILMRMHLDGLRLGAMGIFSHNANAFTPQHAELFESVRGELSLLAFIALSRQNLLVNNTPVPLSELPVPEENEKFIISQTNSHLYQLYRSLDKLANSEQPILLLGEEGVGKTTLASELQQRKTNRSGYYGLITPQGQLVIMRSGVVDRTINIDLNKTPNMAMFLILHQGSLLVKEIKSFPERWQTFLLALHASYREYCQLQIIATQTQPFSMVQNSGIYDISKGHLTNQRYANILCQIITLPPLRYRHDDIPLLLTHYLRKLSGQHKYHTLPVLGDDALRLLLQYNWPGNITELIGLLENAFFRCPANELNIIIPRERNTLSISTLDEAIRQHIQKALKQTGGRISGKDGAAELLGVNSNTLYSKIKKLGIVVKD
ncbi:AAA-type ATPase lid domain-containing protein [Citrobacter europaeus]|uniref:helix-turn-helix domain-containing protein n=1 Tax=Citrobacter europaeus TaxID=1914243 RepID=UPI00397C3814